MEKTSRSLPDIPLTLVFSTTPIVLLALASTLLSQVTPQDRLSESWWAKRHNALLAKIAAKPDAK